MTIFANSALRASLLSVPDTDISLKAIDAKITFVKDDKGKVTHLILHQAGEKEAKEIN